VAVLGSLRSQPHVMLAAMDAFIQEPTLDCSSYSVFISSKLVRREVLVAVLGSLRSQHVMLAAVDAFIQEHTLDCFCYSIY
jgi:hypothetical protein